MGLAEIRLKTNLELVKIISKKPSIFINQNKKSYEKGTLDLNIIYFINNFYLKRIFMIFTLRNSTSLALLIKTVFSSNERAYIILYDLAIWYL